ncbi:M15 family metallopeptidase [Nocardiopsis tropica]|uniref:M15 family metallopeptidase n=2 Tax=Nocardiopsis tropica TaxID=109330 RepID=A0ABU7KXL7_9ACTN|nr:M15 family metallopeptidase [Nocardiopsis umidischolae]MEE2053812.1 M15 family metallopeptidase [Nocardiopsis umidischolae]
MRVELAELRAGTEVLRQEALGKIERYEEESERLEELSERSAEAAGRAAAAGERGEEARIAAARQAAAVYMGADVGPVHAWGGSEGPSGMLERGALLHVLGEHRAAELDRAGATRVVAETVEGLAETAEREQAEAVEAAAAAREEAVEAVTAQEERTAWLLEEQTRLEARLAEVGDAGGRERRREETLRNARAALSSTDGDNGERNNVGDDRNGREARQSPSADTGCARGEAAAHANGRMPESVLCPLPQPGERLRADAAEAFIELDGAYRGAFGRPMCVTDSYRPYHEQVSLFHEMVPGMAARPGTSRHGLGVAVDLCGGVHEAGSPEHEWMLAHAPGYGWDNPPWARGGFEPWHWEFTP